MLTRLLSLVLLLWTLPVAAHQAAIASAHPLATEAGFEVLEAGGNAFDAAIAVAAVLAVVEPYSSGMGGGGFWLLHRQADGHQTFVDARETAPAAAHADLFLNQQGLVDRQRATTGPLAAAIPAQPAAFDHLARHYGRLPLSVTLAPAIRVAEEGFPVSRRYQRHAASRRQDMARDAETARLFLHQGEVPPLGHRLRQPELAALLQQLATQGADGFYRGTTAERLVQAVRAGGGIWTLEDLARYQVKEREPVVLEFDGARIVTAPLPSSGGLVLAETFNILQQFHGGRITPALLPHLTVEAMKRAYRDRAEYMGDPDFVPVPVAQLVSPERAREWARGIALDHPTPSEELGDPLHLEQGAHTTHLVVLDAEGNRVSATLTVNTQFGAAWTVPGLGLLLNNEMDDFSALPGSPNAYGLVGSEANAIAGGKRPLSSMTPTFIEMEDRIGLLGTPGGSRIISMVLLGLQQVLADAPVEHWVSRPRYHHQYLPDVVEVEPAFVNSQEYRDLASRGHHFQPSSRPWGDMHAIRLDPRSGSVTAASDPRGEGLARVRAVAP